MEVYSWDNHLFLWAIYTMAMLVITRWYIRFEFRGFPARNLYLVHGFPVFQARHGADDWRALRRYCLFDPQDQRIPKNYKKLLGIRY